MGSWGRSERGINAMSAISFEESSIETGTYEDFLEVILLLLDVAHCTKG